MATLLVAAIDSGRDQLPAYLPVAELIGSDPVHCILQRVFVLKSPGGLVSALAT